MINKETQTITEQIKCLDGEQYDLNEKRCLPCTYYELIWDSEYKQCKPILKTEFLKQKKEYHKKLNRSNRSAIRFSACFYFVNIITCWQSIFARFEANIEATSFSKII